MKKLGDEKTLLDRSYYRDGDRLITKASQDIESILEHNKTQRNDNPTNGYTEDKSMQRVASIPLVVVEQWFKEGLNVFDKRQINKVLKKLDEYDNTYLKTTYDRLT